MHHALALLCLQSVRVVTVFADDPVEDFIGFLITAANLVRPGNH